MARGSDIPTWTKFAGINNQLAAERIGDDEFTAAVNVDVDDTQRLNRRHGTTIVNAGAAHSLFSDAGRCLFRRSAGLYQLLPNMSAGLLESGFTGKMHYAAHPNGIFMCDGQQRRFFNGTLGGWGIIPPGLPVAASMGGGPLAEGTYQFALTFIRNDGEESGTGAAGSIAATGGIAFSQIPVSAEAGIVARRLYVSAVDGETLYHAITLDADDTTAKWTGGSTGAAIETQFKSPPPLGTVLCEHNGSMLVGFDRFLAYSPPYRPELFDLARQVIPFKTKVLMAFSVQTGVFVGTEDSIIYLAGADIQTADPDPKADYGAIPGSAAFIDAEMAGMESSAAVFLTPQGVCVGGAGGAFKNLTRARYWPASAAGASAVFIREQGRSRYLASLTN